MSIGIYSSPDKDSIISSERPFTITFDGRVGGAQDRRIYIHNNDTTRWYSSITVQAVDESGINVVDGSEVGFSWRLVQKDVVPTNEEWALVSDGNTLSLSNNLGSISEPDVVTFLPVWIRVQIPRSQLVQTIVDVELRISATETLTDG